MQCLVKAKEGVCPHMADLYFITGRHPRVLDDLDYL